MHEGFISVTCWLQHRTPAVPSDLGIRCPLPQIRCYHHIRLETGKLDSIKTLSVTELSFRDSERVQPPRAVRCRRTSGICGGMVTRWSPCKALVGLFGMLSRKLFPTGACRMTQKFKTSLLISTGLFSLFHRVISRCIETFRALASDTALPGAGELPALSHARAEAGGEMQPALLITDSSVVNSC